MRRALLVIALILASCSRPQSRFIDFAPYRERMVREQIVARSPMFIGSTPLPLPLAHAATVALKIMKQDRTLRQRLNRNSDRVKSALRQSGFALPDAPGPIVQVHLKNRARAARLERALLAAGIFPSLIKYPGGPPNGHFRFAISSEHTQSQLDRLVSVLKRFIP